MTKIPGILLLLFSINVYCQSEKQIKFGAKAGLAFSDAKLDFADNTATQSSSTKASMVLGVFLNIPVSKTLFFQPAVLFLSKGTGGTQGGYGYNYGFGYNYFEIPLNLLHKFPAKKGMFFLGGGLSPAFRVSEHYGGDEVKKIDLGLSVLAGYQSAMGFSFNLGYTYGLLNLSTNKVDLKNFTNRYFSVCAGYEF